MPQKIGALLQHWRKARHKSQLTLAIEAGVSARHLCFLETGRAKPSRDMVLQLAGALDVPLRERNALLLAAGFAPEYRESQLDARELAAVTAALDAILKQQEPHPAVAMNRRWDIVRTNRAAAKFFGLLLDGREGPPNVLTLMFDPKWVRPFVVKWEAVAVSLLHRVHREAVGGVVDEALLTRLYQYPGVPRTETLGPSTLPVVPVSFEKNGRRWDYFSTVTTLGTAQDVTAQELRIECFFPLVAK
ncbi:MAG: helix-turn-helix transcriptional regulator [Myxococcaceae bacterium]|nr:helix-turn-helix transcriptional regulator [Myxococcaceae bacterium]